MKKKKPKLSQKEKDIAKALRLMPILVKKNRRDAERKRRFVEKTCGALARSVHKQVMAEARERAKGRK